MLKRYLKVFCLAAALSLTSVSRSPGSAAKPAYTVTKSVRLGTPDHWDYISFDIVSKRLFVAHGDHTDVVDAVSGAVLGRLEGLHGAHGLAVAASGEIFADSGETGQLSVFDPASFKLITTLPAGSGADAVVYEPASKRVAVLDGDAQTATLVDSTTHNVVAVVPLGGEPEYAAADGAGNLFVNIASTGEIARIDGRLGQVTARFAVSQCVSPHGLAIDPGTRRLFATCLNARLLVVDADNGRVLQTLPIGRGSDAAIFDPVHHEVFSSNGDGTLNLFAVSSTGVATASGRINTAPGARTMAIDPASGRIYLVTADISGRLPDAHNGLSPRFAYQPGTVKLLLLDRVPD